jgi:hypothetical protein
MPYGVLPAGTIQRKVGAAHESKQGNALAPFGVTIRATETIRLSSAETGNLFAQQSQIGH